MTPHTLCGTLLAAAHLLAGQAMAQDQAALLSPPQVVREAVAHSHRLKALDQEIEAAGARNTQAKAQGLPLLTADAQATHYTGLEDSALGPLLVIPFIEDRYGAGVTVVQSLYTGGRITSQRQIADHQQSAARHERQGAEADLVLEALTAYWNWSKAFYSVEAIKAAVARMESHARDMRNLQKAGLATDNDALATEVAMDQTRLRLQEARRRVEVAVARISFLTGHSMAAACLPEKAVVPPNLDVPAEATLMDAAHENRAERAARVMEAKAAHAQVQATRAAYAPQVSLIARYEQARPNIMNIPPEDKWQDDAFIGVTLSWSLFDWGLQGPSRRGLRPLGPGPPAGRAGGGEDLARSPRGPHQPSGRG